MEDAFVSQFKEILSVENVTDCVVADEQGLSVLASPNCTPEIAGIASAISQYAFKLETTTDFDPIISLEGSTRRCLIKRDRGISTAIFKKKGVD